MTGIEYVEPHEALRHRVPLRAIAALYGITFDDESKSLCPWHSDSRPSLEVFTSDDGTHERWKCFPCAALGLEPSGGDVFSLVMRTEGVSFPVAVQRVRIMARDVPNMPVPAAPVRPVLDSVAWEPLLVGAWSEARRRPGDLEDCARFPRGQGWAEVLTERWEWGLSADSCAIIPYRDRDGTVVGIRLRRPGNHYFSVDGSRFRVLYGAWRRTKDVPALVCEGETDAVYASAYLNPGGCDVYGVPGAGLVPTQDAIAPLISREVFLCFDGDDAGRSGSSRWATALTEAGSQVWVCRVSDGHDLRSCGENILNLMGATTAWKQ